MQFKKVALCVNCIFACLTPVLLIATNSERNHGREAGGETCSLIGGAAANQIESVEMGCSRLMSISSRMSREIRRRFGLFERS
jgi:hypothetical protein